MSNVVSFKKHKKLQRKKLSNTLCKEGHHRWQIVQDKVFETKSGKLTTVYQCSRCKKIKTEFL